MRNPFKFIPPVEIPSLVTGEGDRSTPIGSLRVKISQSSIDPYEWWAEVEIFDAEKGYPHWNRWLSWEYWAREIAAGKYNWQRGKWPTTFDDDETVGGAKAKGCAMLRAVRDFVPVIVPETQYLTEVDCDG